MIVREGILVESIFEAAPLNEIRNDERLTEMFAAIIDGDDSRDTAECCQLLRFPFEGYQLNWCKFSVATWHLDRHLAFQFRITRPPDLGKPSAANHRFQAVLAELLCRFNAGH